MTMTLPLLLLVNSQPTERYLNSAQTRIKTILPLELGGESNSAPSIQVDTDTAPAIYQVEPIYHDTLVTEGGFSRIVEWGIDKLGERIVGLFGFGLDEQLQGGKEGDDGISKTKAGGLAIWSESSVYVQVCHVWTLRNV